MQWIVEVKSKLRELRGVKWLCTHASCLEDEVWQDLSNKAYKALREQYHVEMFAFGVREGWRNDERSIAGQP